MSEPAPPSNDLDSGKPQLPELHSGILNDAQVGQLLDDIEACTQLTEILPKYAQQQHVGDASRVTISQARELLVSRAVRALQLRYRYENADWWDTIMIDGDSFRVVRIRHDFGQQTL